MFADGKIFYVPDPGFPAFQYEIITSREIDFQ